MKLHGLNKLTLLDYPQHMACTVFTGHCNLRCPFCHNASLVLFPESQPVLPENEFFEYLKRRQGILEGVCVTGGEPALSADLLPFLSQIKSLGYLVKLDTNGTRPDVLREAVAAGLVDYIAMDIKSSPEGYSAAAGIPLFQPRKLLPPGAVTLEDICESADFLMQCSIPYEFRTTVIRELHNKEILLQIANWLKGAKAYYLQAFKNSGDLLSSAMENSVTLSGYSASVLQEFLQMLSPYFQTIGLRGVDSTVPKNDAFS